jgi:signal transduction histidine kinase
LDFQVENQEFYIGDVLEEIRAYYHEKMVLNQISFQIGSYSNCLVYGDPDRLLETLQNIVENAIKYGDGTQIEFSMIREEEVYLIFIKNSGWSLPLRELPHIFDSFFRGSNVAK